ncbi:MAG: hypothetical protein WA633_13360 [Stellaceae bacterium]
MAVLLACCLAACAQPPAPPQQAALPPPPPAPPPEGARPPAPRVTSEAQIAPGRWDVERVRCSDLLGAADDDRAAAAMFHYGYLAARAGIRVIDVSQIEFHLRSPSPPHWIFAESPLGIFRHSEVPAMGLLNALWAQRTGSLRAPVAAHVGYNVPLLVIGYLAQ